MIIPHHGKWPEIHETAFVAPSADVVGDVKIGAASSIWFQVVIRGDVNSVQIGSRTNVKDHSMLHVTRKTASLKIGDEVTIGHRALLHGCTIGNRVLIGMGAIIMDGAVVGDECVVGAGSLITQGKKFPPRGLIMGSPAVRVRDLKPEEIALLKVSADNYVSDAHEYQGFLRGPARSGVNDQDLEQLEHLGMDGEE